MPVRFTTAMVLAAVALMAACDKTIDISKQPAMVLPTYSSKPLLRREQVTLRAFFIAKDRAFTELPSNCVIVGPHGRTAFQSPQKLMIPVYAGKVPTYKVTCKAVIGASERTGEATLAAIDPDIPATAENTPSYPPRRGVPYLIK